MSYGGIEQTCVQYQDVFLYARSGSKWTGQGIEQGLRGKDLLPFLMRDFGQGKTGGMSTVEVTFPI